QLVQQMGVRVTPEAAVLDRSGRLVYRGRIDDRFVDFGKTRQAPTRNDLQIAIQEVLAGSAVQVPATKAIGCFIADLKP
ncbi:MAG: redoxin, partial [Planctomycetota bacterium]|nr:redoxin [Planctomycetota bacterium]